MSEPRHTPERPATEAGGAPPRHILIVDDAPETRFAYRRFLSQSGVAYTFTEVETVADGLAALAAEQVDCVLLDFRLPDADGLEFLAALDEQAPPVVVTTSQGSEAVAVEAMKLGAKDYLVKGSIDAVSLAGAVDKALSQAESERARAERTQRLHELSITDELTGLHNRRYLMERLRSELGRMSRYGSATCVMLIDLDHFKAVNDTHGHLVGDRVLAQFSAVLETLARNTDVAGRIGGEEFCVVLSATDATGATALAERVRLAARDIEYAAQDGTVFRVTCSIGVAEANAYDASHEEVLGRADEALYRAKRLGRDRVCVDTPPARSARHLASV